jgi:hypothetical protein
MLFGGIMKRSYIEKTAIALAFFGTMALTGCGGSSGGGIAGLGGVAGSAYGAYGNASSSGQCIPITSPIGISGQSDYWDGINLLAGYIPQGTVGTLVVTGAASGGQFQRTGADGTLSLNVISQAAYSGVPYSGYTGYSGYGTNYGVSPTQVEIQGYLQLNSYAIQAIGSAYSYNPYGSVYGSAYGTGTVPCVSNISMNMGTEGYTLYGGNVYLWINGSSSPVTIQF